LRGGKRPACQRFAQLLKGAGPRRFFLDPPPHPSARKFRSANIKSEFSVKLAMVNTAGASPGSEFLSRPLAGERSKIQNAPFFFLSSLLDPLGPPKFFHPPSPIKRFPFSIFHCGGGKGESPQPNATLEGGGKKPIRCHRHYRFFQGLLLVTRNLRRREVERRDALPVCWGPKKTKKKPVFPPKFWPNNQEKYDFSRVFRFPFPHLAKKTGDVLENKNHQTGLTAGPRFSKPTKFETI